MFRTEAPRLAYSTLQGAVEQLRAADTDAMQRMADTTLSEEERTYAVGEAEAYHDMATDLGLIAIGYDQHEDANLAITIAHTFFEWSAKVEKHLHAHDQVKQGEGELNALLNLFQSFMQEELACAPMHRAAANAYRTWAFKLLNQFADSLMSKAA